MEGQDLLITVVLVLAIVALLVFILGGWRRR